MLATYRQLARFDRRILEAHERVAVQKARLRELKSRPECSDAEGLLCVLEQSLEVMIQYRAALIEELRDIVCWPFRS